MSTGPVLQLCLSRISISIGFLNKRLECAEGGEIEAIGSFT